MVIQGLWSQLEHQLIPHKLDDFKGAKVGIDANEWLYEAAKKDYVEFLGNNNLKKIFEQCLRKIELLEYFELDVLMVFDGTTLPSKLVDKKKQQRLVTLEADFKKAKLEADLKKSQPEYHKYKDAINITPEIVNDFIQVLKEEKKKFLVAPYEAVAQLAYLFRRRLIDLVVTNNSECIIYGCDNIKIVWNFTGYRFHCFDHHTFHTVPLFKRLTTEMFRDACILSGCDYMKSTKDIKNLTEAVKLIREHENGKEVIAAVEDKMEHRKKHEELFEKALAIYQHQRVFDPESNKLVYLREGLSLDNDFLGQTMTDEEARGIAWGLRHPKTRELFPEKSPVSCRATRINNVQDALDNLDKFNDKFKENALFQGQKARILLIEGMKSNTGAKRALKKRNYYFAMSSECAECMADLNEKRLKLKNEDNLENQKELSESLDAAMKFFEKAENELIHKEKMEQVVLDDDWVGKVLEADKKKKYVSDDEKTEYVETMNKAVMEFLKKTESDMIHQETMEWS